jgi:hypothetical protein
MKDLAVDHGGNKPQRVQVLNALSSLFVQCRERKVVETAGRVREVSNLSESHLTNDFVWVSLNRAKKAVKWPLMRVLCNG